MTPAWLISGLLLSFMSASTQEKIFVQMPLPAQTQNRAFQMLSSQFDVLGANFPEGMMQARVSSTELSKLQALGIDVEILDSGFLQKTNIGLEGYIKPNAVAKTLNQLAAAYPQIAKTFELGRSVENAIIVGIEISSSENTDQKPVAIFNALHHGRELMSTEILMHMVETLLKGYQTDPTIKQWLNSYRIVVVPQVNPDGHAVVHRGYPWWRKNTAGQTVMYGVDLNRNYPTLWNGCNGSSGIKSDDTYRGPTSASEPETKAMLKLFEKYRPVVNISYHTFAEAILYPFGCAQRENPSQALFHDIGSQMRAAITNDEGVANTYKLGSAPEILYQADGGDNDSHWQQFGTFSFAIEAGSAKQGFQPDFNTWRNLTVQRQEGGWRSILARMGRGAIRASVKTNHPISSISYTLKTTTRGKSEFFSFSFDPIQPFRLRTNTGLLYQLVSPGEHVELSFFNGQKVLKSVLVEATDGIVDLGVLEL